MKIIKNPVELSGEWEILFPENSGAPNKINLLQLISLKNHTDDGVKYFSGTATYTKTITALANWFTKDAELWLNLGDVKNLAEVIVNGKSLGIVWKKPFRINVTSALKPGNNKIEI